MEPTHPLLVLRGRRERSVVHLGEGIHYTSLAGFAQVAISGPRNQPACSTRQRLPLDLASSSQDDPATLHIGPGNLDLGKQ